MKSKKSISHARMFNKSTILLTGGTGSWGREITAQLLKKHSPSQVRIFSRGEHAQVNMRRNFGDDPRLRFVIGDVRDLERLTYASQGVDCIFHLAALKHVPICEENPFEAVRTNVIGTQNVIDAALANQVKKVIDVSSDKAASPLNLYGTTKSVGEKLIVSANLMSKHCSFVCIRAGNVLGTQGSVVPLFRNQILTTNRLTITDGSMTRFFMNLDKVVSLLFDAASLSVGGETYVVPMPAAKIGDLADVMIKELGDSKTKKIVIGRRPGEKVHELLISSDESERTYSHKGYHIIMPMIKLPLVEKHYAPLKLKKLRAAELSSKNALRLKKEEIYQMLKRERWFDSHRLASDVSDNEREAILTPFEREGWVRKG